MNSPETRPPSDQDFRDPLENYDPKQYTDRLEHALATEPVATIQAEPFIAVPPTTTVAEAMEKLVSLNIACLMVEEEGRLVGMFSERDALNKVALEYEQVQAQPIREVMTANPICVFDTDSSAAALSVMAATGYRHVPVVNLNQRIVGIVSPSRVTNFLWTYLEEPADPPPER